MVGAPKPLPLDDRDEKMSGLREFFFGKNQSLAQGVVAGLVNAVVASVIVAAAALYVLARVEHAIATAEKRAALRHFQNEALTRALTETSAAYAGLDCVRDPVLLADTSCRNDVESFISLLRAHQHLLVAVVPRGDFTSFGVVIAVAQEMRALRTNDEITQDGPRHARRLADGFVTMVEDVAAHFI